MTFLKVTTFSPLQSVVSELFEIKVSFPCERFRQFNNFTRKSNAEMLILWKSFFSARIITIRFLTESINRSEIVAIGIGLKICGFLRNFIEVKMSMNRFLIKSKSKFQVKVINLNKFPRFTVAQNVCVHF